MSPRFVLGRENVPYVAEVVKVGDKSLINPWIGLHEVPAELNFQRKTSQVLLSFQAHFVMCLG